MASYDYNDKGSGSGMPSMPSGFGTMLTTGLGIFNGLQGSQAAKTAASQQANAIQKAIDSAKARLTSTKADFSPWTGAGGDATARANGLVAGMKQPGFDYTAKPFNFNEWLDPSAQLVMNEATREINASGLTSGGIGGGAARAIATQTANLGNTAFANSLANYQQDRNFHQAAAESKYARDQNFQNNQIDKNMDLSRVGGTMQGQLGGLGMNTEQLTSGLYGDMGAAQAGGTLGASNAWQTALNGVVNQVGKGQGFQQGWGGGAAGNSAGGDSGTGGQS